MAEQKADELNWLAHHLPEGVLVDAAWLSRHGYAPPLRHHYVAAGWLTQPARRVYRRPRGQLTWEQVVISLQALLGHVLVVGGRSALELQGYAHYLPQTQTVVHLYGPTPPPGWLNTLPLEMRFVYHNSGKLFATVPTTLRLPDLDTGMAAHVATGSDDLHCAGLRVLPWGPWDWPLMHSTAERALLELLDELPGHESFHQADMLMEGLGALSPRSLQTLLENCRSVKVKRLLFFFADRYAHAWLRRINRGSIDLGRGKRMLVRGGRFDPVHQITVPEDLYDVQ